MAYLHPDEWEEEEDISSMPLQQDFHDVRLFAIFSEYYQRILLGKLVGEKTL
jgi:hypothetical protein